MRAAVVHAAGPPEALKLEELPGPEAKEGWVTIDVRAFGLNRAELFTRQGDSPGVEFPRIIGIECVGVVEAAPGTRFEPGQTVAALMGGMGRQFDGSYAEKTVVPARCCFALDSSLPWEKLGAIPEMFQTTAGSLHAALGVEKGQTLLVRGGTSSIGMTAASLAKRAGLTVVATTRSSKREHALRENGADHVVVDDGTIAEEVRAIAPSGVDCVLDLVGTTTLRDSLRAARPGGVVCMTGMLGGEWRWERFEPFLDIPSTVRLTAYSGGSEDVTEDELQSFVRDVEDERVTLKLDRTFTLDEIVEAHRYMEANRATGKIVVVPRRRAE